MIELRHFGAHEFQGQIELVRVETLLCVDEFRDQWGRKVRISPAHGAVARFAGPRSRSQHNVDRWGETRGLDVFPDRMNTRADIERAIDIARAVGFSGIGIYPEWSPSPGLHLDCRPDRTPARAAMWGAIEDDNGNQTYVSVAAALDHGVAEGAIA